MSEELTLAISRMSVALQQETRIRYLEAGVKLALDALDNGEVGSAVNFLVSSLNPELKRGLN